MFKLKKKLFVAVIVIVGITVFISCEREKVEIAELKLEEKIALNIENPLVHDFANILVRSMSDEKGRSFIKEEALKEFDGDFDILFAEVKDKDLSKTSLKSTNFKTFGSFLKSFSPSDSKLKSDADFSTFLNSLLEKYPLLQISMPEISEASTNNWNELNYAPLVAVLPDNFDDKTTKVITAYDMDGNVSYLDVNNYPQNPVIVISQNERLVAVSKSKNSNNKSYKQLADVCLESYYETEMYAYYMPIDCGGSGGGGTGGGTGGGVTTYDRDNNGNRDQLNQARFVSVDACRQVEPWPTGRPEFKVIISYIEKIGTSYEAKTITKILTKDDWITRYVFWVDLKTKSIKLPIITWDKEIIGNSMKYTWIEQDDSDTKSELNIAVSSKFGAGDNTTINSSVKVTISAEDDEAGEDVVEYKDGTSGGGTEYNTGIVRFWVNQL
jgi:hypothetical protein